MSARRPAAREELCELTARGLAGRIRRRQVSAAEALEAHLARIAAHNPSLNAVVSLDPARARRLARSADAALARGDAWGPLHGVPMTLKDGHDVVGLRTTLGTAELDRVADEDGAVAARLRAAGAILVGHTNVAAWLGDPLQTGNPVFGRTANPWDPARTPGGSSGGAAAAVAAGLTPLEVGSDLGGSIRLPAALCGVYGLKTTEHRVPLTGFFRPPAGAPRPVRILSSLGPFARDLDDLELALGIVAGPDHRDADVPPVPLGPRRRRPLEELRLSVVEALPGTRVARSVRQTLQRVAARASDAGASVVGRLPRVDWDRLHALFGDLTGAIMGVFSPGADVRDEQRSLAFYLAALDERDRLVSTWQTFFEDVDALVLPAAPAAAFTHRDVGAPVEVDGEPTSYWEHLRLQVFCNLVGLPALAVPAGLDEAGLPLGIQLVGPLWSEARLLEIARELERADLLPGFQPPPGA
jgi:amidase